MATDMETFQFSWEQFCDQIKYRERYFFYRQPDKPDADDELLDPARMLEEIGAMCVQLGLLRTLAQGEEFFRFRRLRRGLSFPSSADLGPPPRESAVQANRMNPPGIPMLYVSRDIGTALAETFDEVDDYAAATLRLLRPARILDLTAVPAVPSLFLSEPDPDRWRIEFLQSFAAEISRPVQRDERIHVDYVPPQVVTEYFRNVFVQDGQRIEGIGFPSARYSGGENFVLFATQDDIVRESWDEIRRAEKADVSDGEVAWIRVVGVEWYPAQRLRNWLAERALAGWEPSTS